MFSVDVNSKVCVIVEIELACVNKLVYSNKIYRYSSSNGALAHVKILWYHRNIINL